MNNNLQDIVNSAAEFSQTLDRNEKHIKDCRNELNHIMMVVNAHREIDLELTEEEITELHERIGDLIIGVKHPKRRDSDIPCKK